MNKKDILIILLLLLISSPAVKALLQPGGFTSHDLTHHVVRQISMDRLLSEGQFPPRWSGELNNGYGYPVFLFNYPLPALVGEVFHKLGFGFVDSVKTILFLSMVILVLGMYLFLKELLGSRLAAFVGGVFYLYAPLRFSNVYVSAAVGSALALAVVPFVFWSMAGISKGKKWAFLVGTLSLAGLILAHNVTAMIFAPVIIVFALWLIRGVREIRGIGIMVLLGLGLSAWFWLPALAEKQYTRFDEVYAGFYKDQFINLRQLVRSPWGYGLSHPENPEPGDMSYQLGVVQIAVVVAFALLFLWKREIREIRVIGGFVLTAFAVSVFLMLKQSQLLWDKLPFLSMIQFPLRLQAVAVFTASIGAALLVKLSSRKVFKLAIVIFLLVLVIYANRNHWNINEKYDPGEQYYLNLETTSTTYGEHLPKWGRVMREHAPSKLEIIEGSGEVKVIKNESAKVWAETEAASASKLRLNQFYFPGWQIKVDGQQVKFDYKVDGESYGLPVFDIQKGSHLILAEFKNTPIRNTADEISMLSVIIVIIVICRLLIPGLFKVRK